MIKHFLKFYLISGFLTLFLCTFTAQAAAPIMHAYVAKIWLDKLAIQNQDFDAFYVGTLFPDARYLGGFKRKKTHFKNVTLSEVYNQPNSFYKGLKLHSWLDDTREKFAVEYGVYKQLEKIPKKHRASFLKFIEDEIMFKQLDWQMVKSGLSNTYVYQSDFGADDKSLFIWHSLLKIYFSFPPSKSLSQLAMFQVDLGDIPQDVVATLSQALPLYAQSPYFQTYTKSLILHVNQKIGEYAAASSQNLSLRGAKRQSSPS
jgi:hypothetical protein